MAAIGFIKQVLKGFGEDKVGQLSAAFAYGAIFSLGPLLLVLVSIIGLVYGNQAAQGQLTHHLTGVMGADTARTIQNVVAGSRHAAAGTIGLVVGIVGMLLAASGLTSQLQNAFNAILGVVPDPKGGLKRTVYVKIKNMILVVLGGIIVVASLVLSAIISGLGNNLQHHVGLPPFVLELLNELVSVAVLTGLLYIVYRTVPDVIVPRRILLTTSLVVTLLFVVGKIVLGIVIGRNGTASAYGAAATLITLLLWIYYSGQILFIGAEGMKVYARNHAIAFKPKKFAIKRTTLHLDATSYPGRMAEAWLRGLRKPTKP